MLINDIINNPEMELHAMYMVRAYNTDTGETSTVFRSWVDIELPFDICMKPCTMIGWCKIPEFYKIDNNCIVLEYAI